MKSVTRMRPPVTGQVLVPFFYAFSELPSQEHWPGQALPSQWREAKRLLDAVSCASHSNIHCQTLVLELFYPFDAFFFRKCTVTYRSLYCWVFSMKENYTRNTATQHVIMFLFCCKRSSFHVAGGLGALGSVFTFNGCIMFYQLDIS